MDLLVWLSLAIFSYVYVGYPLLLTLIVRLRGARSVRVDDSTPRISLVISAYNEAAVLRQKLENALSLDYPADALEIVVISDASTDATDQIVRAYAGRAVILKRQAERKGKTAGLNQTLPELCGEIVVFSDANAMYESDALRKLVRNFADPAVGCVTGEARYVKGGATAADIGERIYWSYEIRLKRLETAVGSMVGGDGAIYAIRRRLWKKLPETAINDFLNPLQIVAAGWRAVYEPEAVCYEETAGGIWRECGRRIRIISRSWRAVFQARTVLNPFRMGFFTVSVVSHKILRWLSGAFLGIVLASLLPVVVSAASAISVESIAVLVVLAGLGAAFSPLRRGVGFILYFVLVSVASLIGIAKGTVGRVSAVWTPVPRPGDADASATRTALALGRLALTSALLLILLALAAVAAWNERTPATLLFWVSVGMLAYVYLGYPVILALLTWVARRPVKKAAIEPTVCFFITANDEADIIRAKLRNALALDYPRDRLTIVVASDGSVDDTNAIVHSFAPAGIKLMEFHERRGKIVAINAGIPATESEVIVFSDANTFLERGAIRALVRNFADGTVGAVSGDVILVGERAALGVSEDLYYRYERWLQQAESEIGSMVGVDGALYALRRCLFVAPPDNTILDDLAISMAVARAGSRVVFESEARAVEQGCLSAKEEFARKSRIVAGAVQFLATREGWGRLNQVQMIFSLLSHKTLRWLSPGFALGAFTASIVLAGGSSFYMAVALTQVGFAAVGIAGCVRRARRWKAVGLAHYFCLVQAAAAVGFVRGLLGQQATTWRRFARAPIQMG